MVTTNSIREENPGCEMSWVKPVNLRYWFKKYGFKPNAKYLVLVSVEGKLVAIYRSNRRQHIGDKLWPK